MVGCAILCARSRGAMASQLPVFFVPNETDWEIQHPAPRETLKRWGGTLLKIRS